MDVFDVIKSHGDQGVSYNQIMQDTGLKYGIIAMAVRSLINDEWIIKAGRRCCDPCGSLRNIYKEKPGAPPC